MASTISVRGEPERVKLVGRALEPDYLLLYIFLHLRSKTWTHVPSGRSRQRGRMCIIGHTLLRIVRCCIWLTRLTLVCEVIRYRLAQVRKNLKKKKKKKKKDFGLAARNRLSLYLRLSFSSGFVLLPLTTLVLLSLTKSTSLKAHQMTTDVCLSLP